jgi:hypothetical protein
MGQSVPTNTYEEEFSLLRFPGIILISDGVTNLNRLDYLELMDI